jgi:hypothetical protein
MTIYLDVAVVRIGEYVTRVPHLKQLRNASAAITAATEDAGLAEGAARAAGARINDEAGHADGVVHLVIPEGDSETATTVADRTLEAMRQALPGAQVVASWAHGSTYPQARSAMSPTGDLQWLPATNEFPLARPCGARSKNDEPGCGQRPGSVSGGLCPDCAGRAGRIGARAGSRADVILSGLGNRPVELGRLPRGARPPESNHNAVIAMDGNGVGALFARLRADVGATDASGISLALASSTNAAFTTAAADLLTADGTVPVVPVTLGGDDICVVVAAVDAWRFVLTFEEAFESALLSELGEDANALSMSAGMVFHHHKQPITQVIAMADEQLRWAKLRTHGSVAAASWLDTTSGSTDPGVVGGSRPVVPLSAIRTLGPELSRLGTIPAAARNTLASLVEDLDAMPLTPADRRLALLAQAHRVGAEEAVDPFLDSADICLPEALDLVRWWR